MTDEAWRGDSFDLRLRQWREREVPDEGLYQQVDEFGDRLTGGVPETAVVSDEDEFVLRVPGTNTFIAGTVLFYERASSVEKIAGI